MQDHIENRTKEVEELLVNRETETYAPPNIDMMNKVTKDIFKSMPRVYEKDKFFLKIWENPESFQK